MPATGNNVITYNMSIRIVADGFSFIVTEIPSGDIVFRDVFAKGNEPVSHTLASKLYLPEITRYHYDSVRVIIDSDSTCVPYSEFRPEDLQQHYRLVYGNVDFKTRKVCYSMLLQLQVVEVFTVPKDICDTISKAYPEATYTNSCSMLLNHAATFCRSQKTTGHSLFAYLADRQMFLISITQGKLLFSNHFMIEQEQNALFFLLSVWKELKMDAYKDTCYIGGDSPLARQTAEEARAYLQNVEWMGTIDLTHL